MAVKKIGATLLVIATLASCSSGTPKTEDLKDAYLVVMEAYGVNNQEAVKAAEVVCEIDDARTAQLFTAQVNDSDVKVLTEMVVKWGVPAYCPQHEAIWSNVSDF